MSLQKGTNMDNVEENRLPVGYGDEWDGSSRNQTNDFFVGRSGDVTILWHVVNNPFEKYDSRFTYQMPALDGSALYVWCNLYFTYPDAFASIAKLRELLYEMDGMNAQSTVHHL